MLHAENSHHLRRLFWTGFRPFLGILGQKADFKGIRSPVQANLRFMLHALLLKTPIILGAFLYTGFGLFCILLFGHFLGILRQEADFKASIFSAVL